MNNNALLDGFAKILALLPEELHESEKAEAQRICGNLKNLSGVEKDPEKEAQRQEHKKALAEVCYIIDHLDKESASRIPCSFKKFLEDQKWENYTPKNPSHLRAEASELLNTVYRHFLSSPDEKAHLRLLYYKESCLGVLHARKANTVSAVTRLNGAMKQIQSADTEEALTEAAKACGLEQHLRFIIEKEEKITLLFS